ncbi:MAG: hypothetical protein AAF915_21140 [Cyanobacteria bacterium P01_D01_bin.50]
MPSKLIFAPITMLLGGWMFTSSFSTNTIQQSTTPYSTQQQIVEVEMPEPAKSFLRFGGAAIASVGTSTLVFWELASKKRSTQAQFLLAPSQNFVPTQSQLQNNSFPMPPPAQQNQEASAPRNSLIPLRIQQANDSEKAEPLQEVPNFYQTGRKASISNDCDALNGFKPQSSFEDKYASVKSLVYENTALFRW